MSAVKQNEHGQQKWPRSTKMATVDQNNHGYLKWPRSTKMAKVPKYERGHYHCSLNDLTGVTTSNFFLVG